MRQKQRRHRRMASLQALEARHLLTGTPFISEFLADNETGLQDQDGDYSDWIEISNPSGSPVNLDGWYLTDNATSLTKWQIPNVTVEAGSTLVVFADSKDLVDPAGELHTNFGLSKGGEYLGLIQPDAQTIVSQYAQTFPAQLPDVSYGYEPISANLLVAGASAKTLVPTDSSLDSTWTQPTFVDTAWTSGTTGIGFSTDGTYDSLIASNVQTSMLNVNASAFIRIPFTVDDLTTVDAVLLKMQYDDGFVAYINGVEVARKNAPTVVAWNSAATSSLPSGVPAVEQFDVSGKLSALEPGTNVLAIQGLNDAVNGDDFLIVPELVALQLNTGVPTALDPPTPGALNLASAVTQVADLQFSHERGFYETPFDLEITTDTPGATVRYTLDGTPPSTTNGSVYDGAVPITTTANVRAIAYKNGAIATGINTQSFIFLDDVIQQPATIPGFVPLTESDVGNGGSVPEDYAMDPAIVNDPAYSDVIKTGLTSIPTLSITVDLEDMFGIDGFYHTDSEQPASFEVIDPNNVSQNLQVNGGIEPHSHDRLNARCT